MCGIAGSLNWQTPDTSILIQAMCKRLAHRGPDAENVVSLGPIVLGHRRLSIIDVCPLSNQPMSDNTGRYWIVYNGELYNYKSLKSELLGLGHHFKNESDTEVIIESYKRYGIDCLQKFQGMFAFALWDKDEQTLFMVRDRLGEKPLYYSCLQSLQNNNTNIIFASELKALLIHPAISYRINPKALSQFLSLNYILTDSCIIEGVEKLPPAHYLLLQKGKTPIIKSYWDLSEHFNNKKTWTSKRHASETLEKLIEKSVQSQMVSDVPLGAFLSGGIDSSTVVASMTKALNPQDIKTFSIGFHESTYSELAESSDVAQYLGVDHHTQYVDADKLILLPQIIQMTDEPFADNSIIPTYFLSEFSRQSVKVCLSGDGGDELFLGYETYVADKLQQAMRYAPQSLMKLLSFACEKYWPVSHHKISFDYKIKQFLKGCLYDFHQAHYFWRLIFTDQEKSKLLKEDVKDSIMQHNPVFSFLKHFEEVSDCHPLDQASYVDIKTWMVDDILVKVDRMSMAHSLEVRAPFLNHHLVEFAASIPVAWKLNLFQKKHLLKLSQAKNLPHKILNRSKKGFNAPMSPWFSGKLRDLARDRILSNPQLCDFIQPQALEKLWQDHCHGIKDNGYKLFGLMCLGLWLENTQHIFQNKNQEALQISREVLYD